MTEQPQDTRLEAPRGLEIASGIGAAILGPISVAVGILGFREVPSAPVPAGAAIICLAFVAVGLLCIRLSVRLLKGRRGTSETGLLNVRGWRTAAWIFMLVGVVTAVATAFRGAHLFAGVVLAIMLVIARFCWTAARDANKPLQPTRAALPNGQRETPGSGPRG